MSTFQQVASLCALPPYLAVTVGSQPSLHTKNVTGTCSTRFQWEGERPREAQDPPLSPCPVLGTPSRPLTLFEISWFAYLKNIFFLFCALAAILNVMCEYYYFF